MNGTQRYRHAPGVKCGCFNRSVICGIMGGKFVELLALLTIRPDSADLMRELAIQAQMMGNPVSSKDLEMQRIEAIALHQRRIDAAVVLFGDGMIDKVEYQRRIEEISAKSPIRKHALVKLKNSVWNSPCALTQ